MTEQDIAAIREQRARWVTAINEGNAPGFTAVVTEDAVWLPFGSDAISGKKNIRSWLEKPFASYDYDYSVGDVRVRVAGDWAVEEARFETRARRKTGEDMPFHQGRYTMFWRKTAPGTWLIERYADHSAPAAEAA